MIRISLAVLFSVIVLAGCKKQDKLIAASSSTPAESIPAVATAGADTFYFKAVIDGEPVNWVVADHEQVSTSLFRSRPSFGAGQLPFETSETEGRYLIANTVIYKNNVTNVPQISAGFNIATKSADRNELLAYFLPGNKSFGTARTSSTDPVKDGVFIHYIDQNGKAWFSNASNSDAIFESKELKEETQNTEGTYGKKWKATFSCRLFDADGNSIMLENGEIYGPVL